MKVMAMRRPEPSPEEEAAVKAAFPVDTAMEYLESHSPNYLEHAAACERELDPATDIVLLPKDRPVPEVAMQKGYRHVTLTPSGLKMLVGLIPEFVDFTPELTMADALAARRDQEIARMGTLQLAYDVVSGNAPAYPDANIEELRVLMEMIGDLRRRLNK